MTKLTAREKRGKDPKRGEGGWRVGEVAAGFAAIAGVTALGRVKRPGPQLGARHPVQVPEGTGSECVSPIAFKCKTTSLAAIPRRMHRISSLEDKGEYLFFFVRNHLFLNVCARLLFLMRISISFVHAIRHE